MKIKVELELTPDEAKELASLSHFTNDLIIPTMTEAADQFQKMWINQMQTSAKAFNKS